MSLSSFSGPVTPPHLSLSSSWVTLPLISRCQQTWKLLMWYSNVFRLTFYTLPFSSSSHRLRSNPKSAVKVHMRPSWAQVSPTFHPSMSCGGRNTSLRWKTWPLEQSTTGTKSSEQLFGCITLKKTKIRPLIPLICEITIKLFSNCISMPTRMHRWVSLWKSKSRPRSKDARNLSNSNVKKRKISR